MSFSHFVETAPLTVCGEWMADGDVQTSNTFAHVTCPACRLWVHDHRLAPGGFPDPPEWASCPECKGDLGGVEIGRIEEHRKGCSRLPL